jgi:Gpi18-like mannosyltransferase
VRTHIQIISKLALCGSHQSLNVFYDSIGSASLLSLRDDRLKAKDIKEILRISSPSFCCSHSHSIFNDVQLDYGWLHDSDYP